MDANEFQQFTISTADPCAKDPLYLACGLCEEAGEVAGKIKKTIRDNNGEFSSETKSSIALELGDCAWYLSVLAESMGFTLSEIYDINRTKINDRISRNVLHGSGDER